MANLETQPHGAPTLDEEPTGKEKNDGSSIIAGMKEIGTIVLKRGKFSKYESRTGRLDAYRQALSIPLPDGTSYKATLTFPTNERMITSASINIKRVGPAPEHYQASEATRKSVTLFGNKFGDLDQDLRVDVNKFFHPEAKEFEKPAKAETEFLRNAERLFGGTHYQNKDGVDMVEVIAPVDRLGEKTLNFAEEFVAEALEFLRKFYQTQPEEDQINELPGNLTLLGLTE